MAYVRCTRCDLLAFTTAYWASIDYCDRCGARLPDPRRGLTVSRRLVLASTPNVARPEDDVVDARPRAA